MAPESTTHFGAGSLLAGKFRVQREIGRGAMGVVLLATDQILGREVALKVLDPALANDETARARLLREAGLASRLAGPHVARVLEAGIFDDGAPYVAFEHLEGETLEAVVDRRERLPVPVAVTFVLEALEGVAEAHALGLVHRDLKPANLFLARTAGGAAIVKVLDFGLARAEDSARLTATGDTLGSPAYMAPEQLRAGEAVGPAADVWALGVTLFELLTGEVPFSGDSIPAIAHKILHALPTALSSLRSDAPDDLERVLARCLAKPPGERFANAGEMRSALEASLPDDARVLAFRTTEALARAGGGAQGAPSGPPTEDALPRPPKKRSRVPLFALAMFATLTAGAVAAVAIGRRASEDAAPDASPTNDAPDGGESAERAPPADAPATDAAQPTDEAHRPPAETASARKPHPTLDVRALAEGQRLGKCSCVVRERGAVRELCHQTVRDWRTCFCVHPEVRWLCVTPRYPCDRRFPSNSTTDAACEGYIVREDQSSEPARGTIWCDACTASQRFGGSAGEACYGFDADGHARAGQISCQPP